MHPLKRAGQLRSKKWKTYTIQMLSYYKHKCIGCGGKAVLVHHYVYVRGRDIWDYKPTEIGIMCWKCHEEYHKKNRVPIKNWFGELIGWVDKKH